MPDNLGAFAGPKSLRSGAYLPPSGAVNYPRRLGAAVRAGAGPSRPAAGRRGPPTGESPVRQDLRHRTRLHTASCTMPSRAANPFTYGCRRLGPMRRNVPPHPRLAGAQNDPALPRGGIPPTRAPARTGPPPRFAVRRLSRPPYDRFGKGGHRCAFRPPLETRSGGLGYGGGPTVPSLAGKKDRRAGPAGVPECSSWHRAAGHKSAAIPPCPLRAINRACMAAHGTAPGGHTKPGHTGGRHGA